MPMNIAAALSSRSDDRVRTIETPIVGAMIIISH
jgi:hypothetical protein